MRLFIALSVFLFLSSCSSDIPDVANFDSDCLSCSLDYSYSSGNTVLLDNSCGLDNPSFSVFSFDGHTWIELFFYSDCDLSSVSLSVDGEPLDVFRPFFSNVSGLHFYQAELPVDGEVIEETILSLNLELCC